MGRLESLLNCTGAGETPDLGDPLVSEVLNGLRTALEVELVKHFAFEEEELFPRLAAAGDDEICDLLTDEHKTILPIRQEMAAVVGDALANGFSAGSWAEFRRLGSELAGCLIDHIEKEEMALIPALKDALSAEDDQEILSRRAL
jgi:hemerythrin-like domain-containing protein